MSKSTNAAESFAAESFATALPWIDAHLICLGCPPEYRERLLSIWADTITARFSPADVTGPLWWIEQFQADMHPILQIFGVTVPPSGPKQ